MEEGDQERFGKAVGNGIWAAFFLAHQPRGRVFVCGEIITVHTGITQRVGAELEPITEVGSDVSMEGGGRSGMVGSTRV